MDFCQRTFTLRPMRAAVLYVFWYILGFLSSCSAEQNDIFAGSGVRGGVNYASVRARVASSLPEKANEINDFINILQEMSQATMEAADKISAHCGE